MQQLLPFTYFGSTPYFRVLNGQNVVLDQHEHFIKQTQRSRCLILGANGPIHLSVPVSKPYGNKTAMKDVHVSYATDWQRIHWKAIESAYASAAFFEDYGEDVRKIIFTGQKYLIDLNLKTIELVDGWLDLRLSFKHTIAYEHTGIDFRSLDFEDKEIPAYYQIFPSSDVRTDQLSILDLIFSEGPMARNWIVKE
ncbi:MAG: hypothetical protein RIT43_1000 [Bacteroidota bacterium]|jgi:hypothetical protein